MEAGVVAVCTVGVVVLLVSGGKPGCSYRGFPEPTLSTPCDPGSQSGRLGSLSPNQSDQSCGQQPAWFFTLAGWGTE